MTDPKPVKPIEMDIPPLEKLAALKAMAKDFNATRTRLICRDDDGNLLSISLHIEADDDLALPLLDWMGDHGIDV